MTLAQYLKPVLNNILDMETRDVKTRVLENLLRWELDKETCKPSFGNIEISDVALYENNDKGERRIVICSTLNMLTGFLKMNDKGRWELVTDLSVVWSS